MDAKLAFLCFSSLLFLAVNAAEKKHKIVAYWGQNAVYNQLKERAYWEKDLVDFCKNYNYDIIVLSFLNHFFHSSNKDSMPGFNFAFHCETPISKEYPYLFRCPKIEAGIKECQKNGKQVLMSLGGAVARAGFPNEEKAKLFAYRVYHLLLEGKDLKTLRPFGNAIMNGVDLDIENGGYSGYTAFVKELRRLEASGSEKIVIGAAPQCPYPDRMLGPSAGRILGDVPNLVDEIYIQFYNNWCHTGNTRVFDDHMKKWLDHSRKTNGPKIFIGVPANKRASGNSLHYRPPKELKTIYAKYKNEPLFGGFMFWDASFDQNNIIEGKHYSDHIGDMFNDKTPITTGKPITLPPFTGKKTTVQRTTKPNKKTTLTKPPPVTRPTALSCKGLADGMYPHPNECSMFLQCAGRRPFVKACGNGLHFNPITKNCDWPQHVKCQV